MGLFAITIIPHHRCAILSLLILSKTTRPRAYLLPHWTLVLPNSMVCCTLELSNFTKILPINMLFLVHGVFLWVQNNDGLAQDCSNSSALEMELPLSCSKPSILQLACAKFTMKFLFQSYQLLVECTPDSGDLCYEKILQIMLETQFWNLGMYNLVISVIEIILINFVQTFKTLFHYQFKVIKVCSKW